MTVLVHSYGPGANINTGKYWFNRFSRPLMLTWPNGILQSGC